MRKISLLIILALSIAGTAYAQDAWFEAAEGCAADYEVSVNREVSADTQSNAEEIVNKIDTGRAANEALDVSSSASSGDDAVVANPSGVPPAEPGNPSAPGN